MFVEFFEAGFGLVVETRSHALGHAERIRGLLLRLYPGTASSATCLAVGNLTNGWSLSQHASQPFRTRGSASLLETGVRIRSI